MSFSRHVGVGSPRSLRFVRQRWLAGFGTAVSLLSVSASFAGPVPLPPVSAVAKAPVTAFGYTRDIRGTEGKIEGLQAAIRRFDPVSGNGPAVYLVTAVHIGEKSYYEQLQQFLNKQDVVLFEGVKPPRKKINAAPVPAVPVAPTMSPAAPSAGTAAAGTVKAPPPAVGLQKTLADVLNLQFQLEAINYRRPNFHNSDLSWDQMEELAAKEGAGTTKSLGDLGSVLSGSGTGNTAQMFNKLLDQARTNPAFAQMFRRMIVELVSSPDKMAAISQQQGQDQKNLKTIIVAERNKVVLADLKALKDNPANSVHTVAVFYGAEHMRDMEQHLVTDLGYRPADTQWLTAITVGPAVPTSQAPAPKM
jgi:hypothetical protein